MAPSAGTDIADRTERRDTTPVVDERPAGPGEPAGSGHVRSSAGALARIGTWAAEHLRAVILLWLVVLAAFGAFAPKVEHALAGAGWQDSTSQSVQARTVVQRDFAGLGSSALQVVVVDHRAPIAGDPAARAVLGDVARTLRADPRVSAVELPRPGLTLSRDGRTGVVIAGARGDTNAMVRAADALSRPLQGLSRPGVSVTLTGDSALWANFNSANRTAMLRSEMLSWPVTIVILVIAFGSLVAAGLPLLLTMVGLLVAAGALVLTTYVAPVSIWALNFALMFALALGIDYALFLVMRFRAALERRHARAGDRGAAVEAVAETMDTAGKAVAFSAVTVLAALASILLVPSPAFRSMALGIMLAVIAVLAATLTLLPAVLGRLGTRINAGAIRLPGRSRQGEGSPRSAAARLGPVHLAPPGARRSRSAARVLLGGRAGPRAPHEHAFHHHRPGERQCADRLRAGDGGVRPGWAGHPPGPRPGRRAAPGHGPAARHPRGRGCRCRSNERRVDA